MTQPQTKPSSGRTAPFAGIKVIAFDADDTLWDCQSHYACVERDYCKLLAPWGSESEIEASIYNTEKANMALLGYGCKAFTLSLVENAVAVSHGQISGTDIGKIVAWGKQLLNAPTTPLPGVEPTLATLRDEGRYRLVAFTKGELLDQQGKLRRSGLQGYFSHVEIVSDKTPAAYIALCAKLGISPRELLMVGNSFKSDIAPAIEVGAAAMHVPYHVTWQLEHAEEFPHERLVRADSFADVLRCVER